MSEYSKYNKLEEFVNDEFNWQNAKSKVFDASDYTNLEQKTSQLYWMPEGVASPYNTNSMGYRTDEFIEKRDLLFAGCSQTWGDGVVYDGIWGNILSKSLDVKSYNLGSGGKSVQFIVQNLIAFCKQYGNPKVIFCLFPEFTRMEMKSSVDFMTSKFGQREPYGKQTYNLVPMADPNKEIRYSKIPHSAEEMIPSELPFSISLDYIKMLELYCKLNKIKLFWGTWDRFQDKYLNKNIESMDFENYVYLRQDKWERRIHDDYVTFFHETGQCPEGLQGPCTSHDRCHQEFEDIYKGNFNSSMDSDYKNKVWGHLPVHQHLHIAQYFEKALTNDSN